MYQFFPSNYRWSYNTLLAFAAGGQLGDIALILPRLLASRDDDQAWHREWAWLARVLENRAFASKASESGFANYLLASLYHTISEHFIPPREPLRLESYGEVLRTFEEARRRSSHAIERVEVPYERQSLPAYYVPAAGTEHAKPAVIFICGLDTTKELWFLRARREFAVRGMHALFIDTPGIGEALRLRGLVTRPDYEKPVAAAVDWLEKRAEVDQSRIGIVGSSLGGYYVTRAAAFEPRLKAAVAWGVIYDYHDVWLKRLTVGGAVATPKFQLMFVTGTESMDAAMERIRDFRVAEIGRRVSCPYLLMHGADDRQVPEGHAQAMFGAIGSRDKEMVIFDGESGGSAHCQFDNHLPALQICADWLGRKLA